jgi:hypothetical protein
VRNAQRNRRDRGRTPMHHLRNQKIGERARINSLKEINYLGNFPGSETGTRVAASV